MSIGSIPVLKVRSLTRSHCRFSPEWRLDENGMIFPGDYVDYESVERIFLRPSQLLYYVLKNNDSSIEADTGILAKCRYSDNELCASRDILIREHFGKSRLTQLSVEERISLASMMRRRIQWFKVQFLLAQLATGCHCRHCPGLSRSTDNCFVVCSEFLNKLAGCDFGKLLNIMVLQKCVPAKSHEKTWELAVRFSVVKPCN